MKARCVHKLEMRGTATLVFGRLSFCQTKNASQSLTVSFKVPDMERNLQTAASIGETPTTDPNQKSTREEKDRLSYIALIGMAILSSPVRKMLLCDIYSWITQHFPRYNANDSSWRNSIRHSLSLNECFVKAGKSENGKGNYWTIHPVNVGDFARGDFRRRRARRKVHHFTGHRDQGSKTFLDEQAEFVPMTSAMVPLPHLMAQFGEKAVLSHREMGSESRKSELHNNDCCFDAQYLNQLWVMKSCCSQLQELVLRQKCCKQERSESSALSIHARSPLCGSRPSSCMGLPQAGQMVSFLCKGHHIRYMLNILLDFFCSVCEKAAFSKTFGVPGSACGFLWRMLITLSLFETEIWKLHNNLPLLCSLLNKRSPAGFDCLNSSCTSHKIRFGFKQALQGAKK